MEALHINVAYWKTNYVKIMIFSTCNLRYIIEKTIRIEQYLINFKDDLDAHLSK